ncbi:MAG: hypothetical protein HYR85_09690 [Planctomycetes bacterium]|nr:hypothetical protein [Planctomycetota bacterium]MBI3847967.1 hypothetical protein [Planctomycetota bacterium]
MRSPKVVVLEITLLTAGVALTWLLLVRPIFAESSAARDELAAVRRELQDACDLSVHVGAAAEKTPGYAARVRELESLVPTAADAAEFFRSTRARATESGLRVVADRPAVADSAGDLVRQRKTWLVEGTFGAIVGWLESLDERERHRLLSIPSLSLRRVGARGLVRGDVTVDVITRADGRRSLAPPEEGRGR